MNPNRTIQPVLLSSLIGSYPTIGEDSSLSMRQGIPRSMDSCTALRAACTSASVASRCFRVDGSHTASGNTVASYPVAFRAGSKVLKPQKEWGALGHQLNCSRNAREDTPITYA